MSQLQQNSLVFNPNVDEEMSEAQRKKEEAWQAYEQSVARGDKEAITEMRKAIFMIRSQVAEISEFVDVTKEMLEAVGDISSEVDGLFEMDFDPNSARFEIGLEKFPRFMREFVRQRRATRYYNDKVREIASKIKIASIRVKAASRMTRVSVGVLGKMVGEITKSMTFTTGKTKGKGLSVSSEINADFERRMANSPVFNKSAGGSNGGSAPAGGASSSGGSVGGTTGGAPASGSSDGIAGDHWGDDIM